LTICVIVYLSATYSHPECYSARGLQSRS